MEVPKMAYGYGKHDLEDLPDVEPGYSDSDREPRRFWMGTTPDDEDGILVCFLDGNPKGEFRPFSLREHNVKLKGKWGNNYPCLRNVEKRGCPLSKHKADNPKAPISVYDALCFTLINMTGYISKKTDKRVKDYREMLVVKGDSIAKFKKYMRQKDGLRGCVYRVSRSSDKKEMIGDDWNFEERLSEEDMKKRFGSEFEVIDYEEHSTTKLRSYEDLEKVVRQLGGEESVEKGDAGGEDDPDDIPF